MSWRIGLRLCLVVLLCLSGCNALSGGETGETSIVTPAPVPTDELISASGLPPGLTEQGVVDPLALGRAHEAALDETSYTYLWNRTVRYTNGTLRAWGTSTRHVVVPAERYYVSSEWHRPYSNRFNITFRSHEYWSDGEKVLVSLSWGNNTTYHYYATPNSSIPIPDIPNGKQFYSLFYAIDTSITNNTIHNGTTLYRLAGTEITNPDALFSGSRYENLRNLTFYAVVDSRGLVYEYRIAYTATLTTKNHSTPVRIVETVRYIKIGDTTVERPPWYSKANRTTPIRISER